MVEISIVISTLLDAGIRTVKSLVYGSNGRNTQLEAMPFGTDAVPIENYRAIVVQSQTREKRFVLGYVNKSQEASPGDHRIYSLTSEGLLATSIWLKSDGTIEVGGDTDFMVRYSVLEAAFNELRSDFNSLVSTYNSHTHAGVSPGGGTTAPTTSSGSSSSADISGAKIDEIKTI